MMMVVAGVEVHKSSKIPAGGCREKHISEHRDLGNENCNMLS
jgi:hypothetical protein